MITFAMIVTGAIKMRITRKSQITYTLGLNEKEASWLRGLVQNSTHKNESPTDSGMRKEIFDGLAEPDPLPPSED